MRAERKQARGSKTLKKPELFCGLSQLELYMLFVMVL